MFCTHVTSSTKDKSRASKDTAEFHFRWINDILPSTARSCRTLKKNLKWPELEFILAFKRWYHLLFGTQIT